MATTPPLTHSSYKIGLICALPHTEQPPLEASLDAPHPPLPTPATDTNIYTLGRIGPHNVAITSIGAGRMGLAAAATMTANMRRTFPAMELGLFVGIGGGVVANARDVRLGDVVVSEPDGESGGVVQYDMFKRHEDGTHELKGQLNAPPGILLSALGAVQKERRLRGTGGVDGHLKGILERLSEGGAGGFEYPGADADLLFKEGYHHVGPGKDCGNCDLGQLDLTRPMRVKRDGTFDAAPAVHYGVIATGNQVMKSVREVEALRKTLKAKGDIKCFEMEAGGIMNDFGCLVIRGISDYADTHKTDRWQGYAAATAAAFAKEILRVLPERQDHASRDVPWQPEERQKSKFLVVSNVDEEFRGKSGRLVERRKLLEKMERELTDCSEIRKILSLLGVAGIGKTQLANSFVRRNRKSYTAAFKISGRSEREFRQGMAGIAKRVPDLVQRLEAVGIHTHSTFQRRRPESWDHGLDHDNPGQDEEIAIRFVLSWLNAEGNTGWILIVDDVGDVSENEEDYEYMKTNDLGPLGDSIFDLTSCLFSLKQGTIILTSQYSSLRGLSTIAVEMPGFDESESMELVERTIGSGRNVPPAGK